MPGAIDVVINWMIGVMSTFGRSPVALPTAVEAVRIPRVARPEDTRVGPEAGVGIVRRDSAAGRLTDLVGQQVLRAMIRRHDQVADIVGLRDTSAPGSPAGW